MRELVQTLEEINAMLDISKQENYLKDFSEELEKQKEDLLNELHKQKKKKKSKKIKIRDNRYTSKQKDKRKIEKLIKENSYFYSIKTSENEVEYNTRFYLSGCRKLAKQVSSKKVRRYQGYIADHGGYRKIEDYWSYLF